MSSIIFIHGIAQEQKSADLLEASWIPALAGGLRNAGHPDLAERLQLARGMPQRIDARMAFYGDLFIDLGAMGADIAVNAIDEDEALALEWLKALAARNSDEQARAFATRELERIGRATTGTAMGLRRPLTPAVAALCRTPFAAELGFQMAAFVSQSLRQVRLYMGDRGVKEEVLRGALELVNSKTQVIIGHSLGSVVAFELAHRLKQPLPLLLTLGSPLGLRRPIYKRLEQCGLFPRQVQRWVNFADPDDFVAGEPALRQIFGVDMPATARFEDVVTVNNGRSPHMAEYYLGKAALGRAVAEALQQT